MNMDAVKKFEKEMKALANEIFHGRGTWDIQYRKEREKQAEALYAWALQNMPARIADAIIDRITA